MKPCRSSPRSPASTRLSIQIDVEPHPMLECLASNMLASVLGELAADGIRATNVALTINGYDPVHPWVP